MAMLQFLNRHGPLDAQVPLTRAIQQHSVAMGLALRMSGYQTADTDSVTVMCIEEVSVNSSQSVMTANRAPVNEGRFSDAYTESCRLPSRAFIRLILMDWMVRHSSDRVQRAGRLASFR